MLAEKEIAFSFLLVKITGHFNGVWAASRLACHTQLILSFSNQINNRNELAVNCFETKEKKNKKQKYTRCSNAKECSEVGVAPMRDDDE